MFVGGNFHTAFCSGSANCSLKIVNTHREAELQSLTLKHCVAWLGTSCALVPLLVYVI